MLDTKIPINFIKSCKYIQNNWKPQVGQRILKFYDTFGDELEIKPNPEILVITKITDGFDTNYAVVSNGKGEKRIFDREADLIKTVAIWIPYEHELRKILENLIEKETYAFTFSNNNYNLTLDDWDENRSATSFSADSPEKAYMIMIEYLASGSKIDLSKEN